MNKLLKAIEQIKEYINSHDADSVVNLLYGYHYNLTKNEKCLEESTAGIDKLVQLLTKSRAREKELSDEISYLNEKVLQLENQIILFKDNEKYIRLYNESADKEKELSDEINHLNEKVLQLENQIILFKNNEKYIGLYNESIDREKELKKIISDLDEEMVEYKKYIDKILNDVKGLINYKD